MYENYKNKRRLGMVYTNQRALVTSPDHNQTLPTYKSYATLE